MQAVHALPGIARRWSGLVFLMVFATTAALVRWSTVSSIRLGMDGADVSPYSFYMLHPNLGWNYFGFMANWHGSPFAGGPSPSGGICPWMIPLARHEADGDPNADFAGGLADEHRVDKHAEAGRPTAGLGGKKKSQQQNDPNLIGTELASGRKAEDDAKVGGDKGNSDTLDSNSVLLGSADSVRLDTATTAPDTARASQTEEDAGVVHQRIVSLGGIASYPETRLNLSFDATRVHDTMLRYLVDPHWSASDPHPFLAGVLPGVSFVLIRHGVHVRASLPLAVTRGDRSYFLDDLNSLLSAEGFSFDSTEMQTIAKVAVLTAYFADAPVKPDTTVRRPMEDYPPPSTGPDGALAFPSVAFKSFSREVKKQPNGTEDTRLTVLCKVNGIDVRATVAFYGTTAGENSLDWFIASGKYLKYQTRQRTAPGIGGGRGSLDRSPALAIPFGGSGSVWREFRTLPRTWPNYFVCVQDNGNSTGDAVEFVLLGYSHNEVGVTLVCLRTQDSSQFTIPCTINDSGCDTVTWVPGPSQMGEYSVWGQDAGGERTNVENLDVEAHIWQAEADGQYIKVHYMEGNGSDPGLSSAELAESVLVVLDSVWDREQPWLGSGVYPAKQNLLHVTLGGCYAKNRVVWYHCVCTTNSEFQSLYYDCVTRYWINLTDDVDVHKDPYYPSWQAYLRTALAHELWHACELALRCDTDFVSPAVENMYYSVEEGQAVCVPSIVWPNIEFSKGFYSYFRDKSQTYLQKHDELAAKLYSPTNGPIDGYKYCLYWRHLCEHNSPNVSPAPLVETQRNLAPLVHTANQPDSVAANCRRAITAALVTCGGNYQNFDASLVDFNKYCCLTQRLNGADPYWDSGGPPPNSFYPAVTPAAGRYLLFGKSSKLWEPTGTTHPHSSHIYLIANDRTAGHGDTVFVHFDRAPGSGPAFKYSAGVVVVRAGAVTLDTLFPCDEDSSRLRYPNSSWDTMYVHVTYLDTITRTDARYQLLVTDGNRDVKPESTRPRDGDIFYRPSGGQKDETPQVFAFQPTVRRLINLGGSLDSFPIQCVIFPMTDTTDTTYDDNETTYVAPGDTVRYGFKQLFNFGDVDEGLYRMKVFTSLLNDSNVHNDTVSVVFDVRDTGLPPNAPRGSTPEGDEYVQYPEPDREQQNFEEHYPDSTEGWRSTHKSYQASCWHQQQTESEFPWPGHAGKYMCLRWHAGGEAWDSLWSPVISSRGRGHLRAKFQTHLVNRDTVPFCINIRLCDFATGWGPELFRFERDSHPDLNRDTVLDLPWGGCSDPSQMYLVFAYWGKDSSSIQDWSIDSFRVEPESVPGFDVGAQEIMNPGPWTLLLDGEVVQPIVKVRNYGCTGERCRVHLEIKNHNNNELVYSETRESVGVPLYSFVKVKFPEWLAKYEYPHNEEVNYDFAAWTELDDECPANDSCVRWQVPVVTRGFHKVSNYPLGKTPRGTALASDGTCLYVKNGKKPTFYRYYPPNSGHAGNCGGWDTLALLEIGKHGPGSYGGGIVFVPNDSSGLLFAHWRGSFQLARLDLSHAEDTWTTVGFYAKLKLGLPMVWDGLDTIFALQKTRSSLWKLLAFSVSQNIWREVSVLPCPMRQPLAGGMCRVGRKLYLSGFKNPRDMFLRFDLDRLKWDTLASFPNSSNYIQVAALTTISDSIYLVKDKAPTSVFRYDTAANSWAQLDTTPLLKYGTCISSLGRNIYLFDGGDRKDQELWRYVVPTGSVGRWMPAFPAARSRPRHTLVAGQLYGTPRSLPSTDPGGGQEVVIDTSGTGAATPRWSSDGNWLVYAKWDTAGFAQIWRCPASGGSPQQLTFDEYDKENPDCSPVGQYVVFQYSDDEGYSRIGRTNLDGSGQTVLSPAHEDCEDPHWSRDGSYIGYLRADAYDHWQVWRMDADGGSLEQLTTEACDHLDPAPGDSYVAYTKEWNGFAQVFCVPAHGGTEKQLTNTSFEHRLPCLSPVDDWVAYERDDSTGSTQVCRVQWSNPYIEIVVTSSNCDNEAPRYTSDGLYILFRASDNLGTQVCEVPAHGDSVAPLTPVAWDYDEQRCSPDSRWVVYAKEDTLYPDVGIVKVRRFLGSGLSVFSLDKSVFDATRDSVRVDFSIESDANVTLVARHGTASIRTILNNARLSAGDYQYYWGGQHDGSTSLALPDSDYSIKIAASDSGWSDKDSAPVTLKGTQVPATITSNTTWTAASEPYVLSGHNLNISNGATLTIQQGVRVMIADSGAGRCISVNCGDSIAANGTAQDSTYFMPYRKMFEAYNPAKRGWWDGIFFDDKSDGGQFSYCVFENGGNGSECAIICPSTTNSGRIANLDHCHFRGSLGWAIHPYDDDARDRFDADYCAFEYCASYPICNIRAMDVAGICTTCTFANNDMAGLYVHNTENSEHIQTSCTWPCMSPGWHYDLDGDLQVWSNSAYPVLTIGAGATIRMPYNGEIRIGYHNGAIKYPGALAADGTPGAPISFVGSSGPSWYGLRLDWDPDGHTSLRYCIFKDGVGQSRLTKNNVTYYPMLFCDGTSPNVYRCKFLDGNVLGENDRGTGVYMYNGRPHVSQCKFIKNECGIVADFPSAPCCTTYNCLIDSGEIGLMVVNLNSSSRPCLRNTNVFCNDSFGVKNGDSADSVNASNCWWGPHGGGAPGDSNNGVNGQVIYTPWSDTAFTIWSMDAQAVSILEPVGWHVPGQVTPRAVLRNHLDTTVTFTTTLDIGTVYRQSIAETLAGSAVDTVNFPQATLDSGWYNLGLAVDLAGDEDTTNDRVSDTVWVRDSVDAAALAVLAPPGQITVDDTVSPRVRIANYGMIARQIPVGFYLDSACQAIESTLVAAHESTEVTFDARTFPPGTHQVRFICGLPLDDNRHNDTASAVVNVNPGDYWVAQDSSPYMRARVCWDKGQYVYAASRGGSGVSRFNTLANNWSAVSSPAVETIFGITSLKGQVYVLGKASSLTLDASGQTDNRQGQPGQVKSQEPKAKAQNADESRSQTPEGRIQSAGQGSAPQNVARTTPSAGRQAQAVAQPTQDANHAKHGGALSNALGIYRYVAAGDSWVLVTTCDSTIVPCNGSNIVGDDAGSIYLIEGGSNLVQRYIVSKDSWVSNSASYAINRWGAAAWARGKLYALADSARVQVLDTTTGQWSVIGLDPGDASYGTALCADPVIDRLFAFCHRPPWNPNQVSPFRERRLQDLSPTWNTRADGVTDRTGTALCFGSTQAYCLNGREFWRYRPDPVYDAAAVAKVIPDTVPRESLMTPLGVVQNSWQDTLHFSVHMAIGPYSDYKTDTVPPQRWDTVAFSQASLPPGTQPVTLTVSLDTEQYHYNDTVYGSLFVRCRTDAQALAVLSPTGKIPYDGLVAPEGKVSNNSDSALTGWASMTVGGGYTDTVQVVLPALAESSIVFDTCHLRLGDYQATLHIHCTGDEVPGNDEVSAPVHVVTGDYWKVLAQCPDNEVRLVGGLGQDAYSVCRNGANFRCYNANADTWESKATSPLSSNLSICRFGLKAYDLGNLSSMDVRDGSPASRPDDADRAKTGLSPVMGVRRSVPVLTDGPPAIVRYNMVTDTWDTLTTSLPATPGEGSCLFATDDSTLYLLSSGFISNFWRYNIAQDTWISAKSLPGPGGLSAWTSGCYDDMGHICVLTNSNGGLFSYDVAQDSWAQLSPLDKGIPISSALSREPLRNRLYAFWPTNGGNGVNGFYAYGVDQQQWQPLEQYPSYLSLTALAQSCDRTYGHGGMGTFARYVPVPMLCVSAQQILVPRDTERCDSAFTPTGVIHNNSQVPVWCNVSFSVTDSTPQTHDAMYLQADQTDTVYFSPMFLPAGRTMATLQVSWDGGSPGNTMVNKWVQVEGPWEPRNQPMFSKGRLDADSGTAVFGADRNTPTVAQYNIATDNWQSLLATPFASGTRDLSYFGGRLYAVGLIQTDNLAKVRGAAGLGTGMPVHPAIYQFHLGDSAWTLVTDTVPASNTTSVPWIVATSSGIYYQPGTGKAFYHFDTTNGWQAMRDVPKSVVWPAALDWDRNNTIFMLAATTDSQSNTTNFLAAYSLAADSWRVLEKLPVQPESALVLAAEPSGNLVLALLPGDSSHALLYGYDRSQNAWTQKQSPTWNAFEGAAMTWAGTQAYALTGQTLAGQTWFWCYDPGFAAYWGSSQEGVAGRFLPVMRWQMTCAPNPFTGRALIRWQVPKLTSVTLKVYNTSGRLVSTLAQGTVAPGSYTTTWNGCDQKGRHLAAGVYVCTLDGQGTRITRKVVLTE